MKHFIFTITSCIILSGCTKTLYTHEQVMANYQTKQQVVAAFGLPTEKRTGEGIEEWLYNYGSVSLSNNFGSSRTNANVYGTYNGAVGNSNTYSNSVTSFSQFNRFLKFTFDANGNVIKWQTQGVDNSVKKKNTVGTVLVVALSAVIIVGFIALLASADNSN